MQQAAGAPSLSCKESRVGMSQGLAELKCSACSGEVERLSSDAKDLEKYLAEIPEWDLIKEGDVPKIQREYRMKNFNVGIEFFGNIRDVAEAEKHHPDLYLEGYQRVTVKIYTHKVQGLTVNDFILAAKIDKLEPKLSKYHKSKAQRKES
uniref:4a-hydroxytetrahydrobiopterin dehydratase n=1 Tax=Norrisiella sphaerica TaxID=552664 RepID=A0A7S2VUW8_9EUKA